MSYHERIGALAADAEHMERVYQTALEAGEAEAFKDAVDASHTAEPENLLYAAWFHRLRHTAAQAKEYVVAWAWAVPLAVINGLLFWLLSDRPFMITITGFRGATRDFVPSITLLAAPLAAVFVLTYLTVVGRKSWRLGALTAVLVLMAVAYVLLIYPQTGIARFQEQYLALMMMHLPLLSWAAVGAFLVARHRDPANRIGFLIKSLQVIAIGGLCFMILGLFTAITIGLFTALDVDVPETVQRLLIAGGIGVITVVAPAGVYDPTAPPAQQAFDRGFSKLVSSLVRVLLPLTLLVLVVYLAFIPFNFRAPFESREVLIIYNVMLFAVMALLVGATWVSPAGASPRTARRLRWGVNAVASLAVIVGLYALVAILYRTAIDRLTPNRLASIGWNVINIGLLLFVLARQWRAEGPQWMETLRRSISTGTVVYAVWGLAVVLAVPWLFGINQQVVEGLPLKVQEIVYEHPAPILLKCASSPHIYLLEGGEKRWIDTIETFTNRGYTWREIRFVTCDDLRAIPDGVPIPADAGPPPQP